jgi:SpoVK/Ycf46/Vps4 family AAA+-type ATPase
VATSEQLNALIKAHYHGDDERFKTLVLQIAAHEAKIGHSVIAQELKEATIKAAPPAISRVQTTESGLMFSTNSKKRKSDLIVHEKLSKQIDTIILEFTQRSKLNQSGYKNRKKILLEGLPGTGKTLTASVIAGELKLPLFIVQSDKLISKYMGETGVKLRQIFDAMTRTIGIYFFDEFDSIGSERSSDNDVKEMHRVLNLFLQFIEQDTSESIIIAATNSGHLLDQALFRRFDDVLRYNLPAKTEIEALLTLKLNKFAPKNFIANEVIKAATSLCHADIAKACENAIKHTILNDKKQISKEILLEMLAERKAVYARDGE